VASTGSKRPAKPEWFRATAEYEKASWTRAFGQLLDTLLPYGALWAIMVYGLRHGWPYPLILLLALAAAGFLVRLFILFHDCCHGSFFPSRWMNTLLGSVTGVLTFTPLAAWRADHNTHHVYVGNLDHRGVGDVDTWTVEEYLKASTRARRKYRAYRHPFVLFVLGPIWTFLISFRFFPKSAGRKERLSVLLTDIALLGILALAGAAFGFKTFALIQGPVIFLSGVFGIWLFYVQHQFEGTYWEHEEEYDPMKAALEGSSFYKLPRVLQWFSGNIGFHHIHHLRPRIPNYNLERCFRAFPPLREVRPLTLRRSLACMRLALWDERAKRMVSFKDLERSSPPLSSQPS
jgi:omega-6 fatty acid desaturase (delta-12 desaturase)